MNIIRNLLRWARTSKAGSDDGNYHIQQLDYMGKLADSLVIFPYGVHGNIPPECLALMFAIEGNPENRAHIGWKPDDRPKMSSGEVCFYHPLIPGLIIHLQKDGKMLVKSKVKVTVDAPEAEFTGNLTVKGNFHVDGNASLGQGGEPIARQGDAVQVKIESGSSEGTWNGTITAGSSNHTAT